MKLSLTPEEFVELCRLLFPLKPAKKNTVTTDWGCATGVYAALDEDYIPATPKKKRRRKVARKRRK